MAEVVLALDLPSGREAIRLLDQLPEVRWVKVGSIVMTAEGPDLVRVLADRGLRVFLDLKWHDIPNTVAGAVKAARRLGASMVTVHALGGRSMMEAAAAAAGGQLAVVAVTVLTSLDPTAYAQAVGRRQVDLAREVERQSGEAVRAGLAGVVCSPAEVGLVRRAAGPAATIVVPGIRRAGEDRGDQARVATAAEAAAAGATHLVVGRPVLQAADPATAFGALLVEAR
ncbi:MAG TPA: orotidine-5'-phosphate decarboxylase [Gemmatimonadales bacterium]|nr:orotidine-5'-phosphate decarboxylase [Gemmatimonadales bacterium]